MSRSLALSDYSDPSEIGYPATLPVEIALRTAPIESICASYGLTREDWNELRTDPVFKLDLMAAVEMVKQEGMSFRLKARLQSDELLKKSWQMIHDNSDKVPPSVKADLIKFTVRAAGLSEEKQAVGATAFSGTSLSININL